MYNPTTSKLVERINVAFNICDSDNDMNWGVAVDKVVAYEAHNLLKYMGVV